MTKKQKFVSKLLATVLQSITQSFIFARANFIFAILPVSFSKLYPRILSLYKEEYFSNGDLDLEVKNHAANNGSTVTLNRLRPIKI